MTSTTPDVAPAPRWIVCRGQMRSVVDGEVYCPQPDLVAWHRCLACRSLEAVDDERERGCGEIAASASAIESAEPTDPVRWPQLILELL